MLDLAAPPKRAGAETNIAECIDTVVATLLETFDELWEQAQWVAASDRLVIELAVVDVITAIRASRHCATIHIALEVDETEVGASLTHAGEAAALTGMEVARRYGLGDRVFYRHTPTGGVVRITHPLRQPPDRRWIGAHVREQDAAGHARVARPLTSHLTSF